MRGPGWWRRAQPWLGTLVEISVYTPSSTLAMNCMDAAFAAIARVHRLMSFHEAGSELSRLNRADVGEPVAISSDTMRVLRFAQNLQARSGGLFACTIAPALLERGLLPPLAGAKLPGGSQSEPGLLFDLAGSRVCKTRPCLLDLGGVAKGYAVDRAMDALMVSGIEAALVNAGGDLRHWGRKAAALHLRHPASPGRFSEVFSLSNQALASSSSSGLHGQGALVNSRSGSLLAPGQGVSVVAPSGMVADALTKVVLASGDIHHPLLRHFEAAVLAHYLATEALAS